MDRTYALLSVKSFDDAARTISGIASTPTPDLHGDIVESSGAHFRNPIPLLFHHDKTAPVGSAELAIGPEGLVFTATLARVAEPGRLRDRVEEAWHSIKSGVIRAVSIGYLPRQGGAALRKDPRGGFLGFHLKQFDVFELSLVTIPANLDASILTVKSLDAPYLAAASRPPRQKDRLTMTTTEHIQNFQNKRAAEVARMDLLMAEATEAGETLAGDKAAEYDRLALVVKGIDDHLSRLRELERVNAAAAQPIASVLTPRGHGGDGVAATPIISIRPNVEPGTAFVRMACAKMACRGNLFEAAAYAERWKDSTPEVALMLKAAIAPGTTTDATWAKPLVNPANTIVDEFLTLLRPATILGKISGFSRVPFNAQVPTVTSGGSYNWVGEGLAKPVTKMAFGSTSLGASKAAGIIVLTEELVRLSNPSAEAVVRREMINGIAAFLDAQFIDPAVAEVPNVHPASITNGIAPIPATTNPLADILALITAFTTAEIPLSGLTLIMSETTALILSFYKDGGGNAVFPNLKMNGGAFNGVNVVTSSAAGDMIIGVIAPYILYADDGGVTVDISREASVQMDSAPANPADATTVLVSLWQNNLVGLRAERFINWKRGNNDAVAWVDGVAYAPPVVNP